MLGLSLGGSTGGLAWPERAFTSPGGSPDSLLAANTNLRNLYNAEEIPSPNDA